MKRIRQQSWKHHAFYALFGIVSFVLMIYYLSNTIIHFTTPHQFPINSFFRFPLTALIFPAEVFSFVFGMYFVYVLFKDAQSQNPPKPLKGKEDVEVAVLVPVYNEPKDVVDRTLEACGKLEWPGKINVYLCDDSDNENDMGKMDDLADRHGCEVIRREERDGYKAGNVNNAVKQLKEKYFAILDADQAPTPQFLMRTMDHFTDPEVGFVQTPQYFVNDDNVLERTAGIGSDIFFQSMCRGRAMDKAMVFCGTNAVIRKAAFEEVKGFSYYTATEDIDLGLRMNEAGYHGAYVPEILVQGYAPSDFKAYASQQYRWSNGNLAILRESWIKILLSKITLRQKIHSLAALGWWMIGIVSLIYILVPLVSVFFGLGTHHTWLSNFLLVWLYFNVVLGIGMIYVSLQGRLKGEKMTIWDAILHYSLLTNSTFIYVKSAFNAAFKRYVGFVRTSKKKASTGIGLVKWNLIFAAICFAASIFALFNGMRASDITQMRTYLPISVWLLFYAVILSSSVFFVGNSKGDAA